MTLTRQEIFNKVWERAKDKRMAIDKSRSTCSYRSNSGLKCFIGIFITDEEYNLGIEGIDITGILLSKKYTILNETLSIEENLMFLRNIQCVHDTIPSDQWEENLRCIAVNNRLQIPGEN